MFCRNCGQKLADGDKFCSGCGTRTEAVINNSAEGFAAVPPVENVSASAPAEEKPLFEPFDFKAFGFDFSDLGLGTGAKKEETAEGTKPTPPAETFDWNTSASFPDANAKTKTEEVDFNWSLTSDEAAEPEVIKAEEPVWTGAEVSKEPAADLEKELFGDIGSKADETRKQSEEIDKFFTFHKKNEEFQKILDREYEKVKSGNILTEEMNAADVASEEKFTARQPEDPMEEMFAEAGVIRGYEPKPVETDVLERIEAAETEKKIREEAARIADEKRAEMAAAEAAPADNTIAEAAPADEAPAVAEEPAADTAPAVVVNEPEAAEEPTEPEMPEKTKQVDKAAILAEIALASEMVERDRAFAAAQEAEAAAAAEAVSAVIPDFLGHAAEAAEDEAPAVAEITLEEPAAEPAEEPSAISVEDAVAGMTAEPAAEEESAGDIEFDLFEQLEAVETPAEEIILTDNQTIEDLFADLPAAEPAAEEETVTEQTVILTEDSVAEILKTVEQDTTTDDTMSFTAHALGAILAEAEQTDPDAKEVVVTLEDLTALEEQAANGTLTIPSVEESAEEEDEEEYTGGKGRTFLKICLVILVILLVLEIAGVAIKIAAPTSGAANFIDNQLNKVFQLIGDEDTAPEDYNA